MFKITGIRQWKKLPIRLAMSLLVKNEQDLIEANIRYHASVGVDKFLVMDNGSSDNTVDIVKQLSDEFDIELILNPVLQYRQSDWATKMSVMAREQFHCDWFIANDADEFWVPESGSLKTEMSRSKSIIDCSRYDMQLTQATEHCPFYERVWKTHHPILFSKQDVLNETNLSMNLGKISGKVMVNIYGLIRSKSGNHHAWHIRQYKRQPSTNITIYHYPIGSFEHFKWLVDNHRELCRQGFDRATANYRRWMKQNTVSELLTEYQQMQLTDSDIQVLSRFGIIAQDQGGKEAIQAVIGKIYNKTKH